MRIINMINTILAYITVLFSKVLRGADTVSFQPMIHTLANLKSIIWPCVPLFLCSSQAAAAAPICSRAASAVEGDPDEVALTMIQSAFRGHLTRCSLAIERWLILRSQKLEEQIQSNLPAAFCCTVCMWFCLYVSSGSSVPLLVRHNLPPLSPKRARSAQTVNRTGEVNTCLQKSLTHPFWGRAWIVLWMVDYLMFSCCSRYCIPP